jgi:spore maturation protein CgeB
LPYETYVPVQWDFSDVEDRIRYYLAHPEEREAIVDRAFDLLHRYFRDGQFLRQMERVFVS